MQGLQKVWFNFKNLSHITHMCVSVKANVYWNWNLDIAYVAYILSCSSIFMKGLWLEHLKHLLEIFSWTLRMSFRDWESFLPLRMKSKPLKALFELRKGFSPLRVKMSFRPLWDFFGPLRWISEPSKLSLNPEKASVPWEFFLELLRWVSDP